MKWDDSGVSLHMVGASTLGGKVLMSNPVCKAAGGSDVWLGKHVFVRDVPWVEYTNSDFRFSGCQHCTPSRCSHFRLSAGWFPSPDCGHFTLSYACCSSKCSSSFPSSWCSSSAGSISLQHLIIRVELLRLHSYDKYLAFQSDNPINH